jgi:hypothetical protein
MRGIPTSRAYWELKADQVLNRVFDAETAIEVEVLERPPEPKAEPAPVNAEAASPVGQVAASGPEAGARQPRPKPQRAQHTWPEWMGDQPSLVLAGIGVTALIAAGGSLLLIGLWSQSQQALRQERNLLLLERLRNLGPAAAEPAPSSASAETADATAGTATDGLPPPPPNEPWMQELATLPSSGTPAAEPLRVPVSDRITSPPPAASGGSSARSGGATPSGGSGGTTPQLVGVVQVPGRSGSAIFQVGGSSTSAGVGESIGGSGWRLVSASGDSAVIERGGEQRRLSISSGF